MIYGIGVNDMPKGWRTENELNKRIYIVWYNFIRRCYDEKYQEKFPTYKDCYVCDRWLILSNFVEDIKLIENYELWLNNPNQKISLDKDIKSNGKNKCYCLEQCQFITKSENSKQAVKTRDNNYLKGENHPNLGYLIARYTLHGVLIDIKYNFEYKELGFDKGNISKCCNGKQGYVSLNGEKFTFRYYNKKAS